MYWNNENLFLIQHHTRITGYDMPFYYINIKIKVGIMDKSVLVFELNLGILIISICSIKGNQSSNRIWFSHSLIKITKHELLRLIWADE